MARLPSRPAPAWPEALLAAFPVPPDRNPSRPWWRAIPLRGPSDYDDCSVRCKIIRDDGLVLEHSPWWVAHSGRPYPPNPDFDGEWGNRTDLDREADEDEEDWDPWELFRAMEADDKERPRPHPGFRAGQVWALVRGDTVVGCGVLQPSPPHPRRLIYAEGPLLCSAKLEDGGRCLRPDGHNGACGDGLRASDIGEQWSFGDTLLDPAQFDYLFRGQWDGLPGAPVTPPVAYLVADPCCPHLAPWAPETP